MDLNSAYALAFAVLSERVKYAKEKGDNSMNVSEDKSSIVIDGKVKYGRRIDIDDDPPQRYAARRGPMNLRLFIYSKGDEETSQPLCTVKEWEDFATWGAEQGGELQRLAVEGFTDPYRTSSSVPDLLEQIKGTNVPEQYRALAGVIRNAAQQKDVEGLLVSEGNEDL